MDSSSISAFCQSDRKINVQFQSGGQQSVSAGNDFLVSGSLSNTNGFPINDVSLYVQIVKLPQAGGSAYDAATDTVASFVPVNGLDVPAGSTADFSFKWSVPAYASAGNYQANVFAVSYGQFPVAGSESSNDVAYPYPFSVTGQSMYTSYFDQSSVKVNGSAVSNDQAYVSGAGKVSISLDVDNDYSVAQSDIFAWKVYSPDIAKDENIIYAGNKLVSLKPGQKTTVSFSIPKIDKALYYVVGELSDAQGRSSFISVKIIRSDINEPALTMFGVSPVPPSPAGTAGVFGCISDSSSAKTAAKNIKVYLIGADGLAVYTNTADISTASTGGFLYPFKVPDYGLTPSNLIADVLDGSGSVLVTSTIKVCADGKCVSKAPVVTAVANAAANVVASSVNQVMYSQTAIYYLLLSLAAAGMAVIAAIMAHGKKSKDHE